MCGNSVQRPILFDDVWAFLHAIFCTSRRPGERKSTLTGLPACAQAARVTYVFILTRVSGASHILLALNSHLFQLILGR